MHKTVKEDISVDCANLELFYAVLTYCYSGHIVIDRHNVDELLYLSDHFAIPRLKSLCCEYLVRNLNARNVFQTFDISTQYGGLTEVNKQSLIFLQRNFDYLYNREEMLNLSMPKVQSLISERLWPMGQERVLAFLAKWVAFNMPLREAHFLSLLQFIAWNEIDSAYLCQHIDQEPLYQNCAEALFSILHVLDRQNIYLGPRFQDLYQSLHEKLLPDQDLDELNDTNSFLSMAINSAVKDLEHSEVDPDWFLQNEPPTNDSTQPANNPTAATTTLLPRQQLLDKQEKYKDMDFEIVEQVINEQRMSEEKSKYRGSDLTTSIKRYDPKFRALNEVFRQMEEEGGVEEERVHLAATSTTTTTSIQSSTVEAAAATSSSSSKQRSSSSVSDAANSLLNEKSIHHWEPPSTPSPPPPLPSSSPPCTNEKHERRVNYSAAAPGLMESNFSVEDPVAPATEHRDGKSAQIQQHFLEPTGPPPSLSAAAIVVTSTPIHVVGCLLYTSPSPRDRQKSRMPSSA